MRDYGSQGRYRMGIVYCAHFCAHPCQPGGALNGAELLGVVFFGSRDLRTVRRVALEVERVIDIAASLDFG